MALDVVPQIKLGVSAYLLGQRVRFDGKHKHNDFLTGPFADCVEWVPVCPEVGSGMGVPWPPIRLVGDPEQPRAIGVAPRTGCDQEAPDLRPAAGLLPWGFGRLPPEVGPPKLR